jgi:hypothetical protein
VRLFSTFKAVSSVALLDSETVNGAGEEAPA